MLNSNKRLSHQHGEQSLSNF